MRRLMCCILFVLLCMSTNVLSPTALAAPREMNKLSTFTALSSFQMGEAYRSSRYSIAYVELRAYPAMRYRPHADSKHKAATTSSTDAFFYGSSPGGGAE